MSRTNVPVNFYVKTGLAEPTPTTGDATNNHSMVNDGKTVIKVKNTNGASTSRTFTIHIAKTVEGQSVTDIAYPMAAGATSTYGPFDQSVYGNPMTFDVAHADLVMTAFSWARV